jgi:hypothetical protein
MQMLEGVNPSSTSRVTYPSRQPRHEIVAVQERPQRLGSEMDEAVFAERGREGLREVVIDAAARDASVVTRSVIAGGVFGLRIAPRR